MKIRFSCIWEVLLLKLLLLIFHATMADDKAAAQLSSAATGEGVVKEEGEKSVSLQQADGAKASTDRGEDREREEVKEEKQGEKEEKETDEMASKKSKPQSLKKKESEAMRRSDTKSRTKAAQSQWPSTIEDFGYEFRNGVLTDMETGGPFEFAVSDNHSYNQKRYEALGEIITTKVYELLETEGGLKKHYVPEEAKPSEPRSFIFVSNDVKTNAKKMMVLIHGSGVVRAGQWTRKLIINNSLDHGTQLPFIKSAKEQGYSVVVLNTNYNSVTVDGKKKRISRNGTPEDHTKYVWKTIISKSPAKKIAIVAHSFGGVCTVDVAREFREEFIKRVFAVAFTDSVHSMSLRSMKKDLLEHFENVAINWAASDKPLDTPLKSYGRDARRVSAGIDKHEWTSWSSYRSIFKFFDEMYRTGRNTIGEPDIEEAMEVKADDDVEEAMRKDEDAAAAAASKPAVTADEAGVKSGEGDTPAADEEMQAAPEETSTTAQATPASVQESTTAAEETSSAADTEMPAAAPVSQETTAAPEAAAAATTTEAAATETPSAAGDMQQEEKANSSTTEEKGNAERPEENMDTGDPEKLETANTAPGKVVEGSNEKDEKTEL